jgi:hypothetical protein
MLLATTLDSVTYAAALRLQEASFAVSLAAVHTFGLMALGGLSKRLGGLLSAVAGPEPSTQDSQGKRVPEVTVGKATNDLSWCATSATAEAKRAPEGKAHHSLFRFSTRVSPIEKYTASASAAVR